MHVTLASGQEAAGSCSCCQKDACLRQGHSKVGYTPEAVHLYRSNRIFINKHKLNISVHDHHWGVVVSHPCLGIDVREPCWSNRKDWICTSIEGDHGGHITACRLWSMSGPGNQQYRGVPSHRQP